jgi:glycosyltransferase involved in cell wall biosynthesis
VSLVTLPLRIAVVTPLPVSGIEGGNERHWRSLVSALSSAGHDARLVAEVSPEADLHEVLSSYAMFHAMDLSHADVVISGKYPSFMVRHPRHIRHLNHPLRGLYEHYPTHLDTALDNELQTGIDGWGDDVDGLIAWADAIAAERPDDPAMSFPGPFARAVVRRLDLIGRDRLAAEATVSETVASRPSYVDPSRAISIIPPLGDLEIDSRPTTSTLRSADAPFLFTFGRLDHGKRVDLILRSFATARRLPGMRSVELLVAGDGPLFDELSAAAGSDVRLVGRLDDDALSDHLRRATGVVLAPIDEDYGLVAAEAMAAGAPVITTTDSGGVAEQVTPGRNGLVVPPRAPLLAKAMRDLIVDPERAARMGRSGQDAVRAASWSPMLSLIDEVCDDRRRRSVLLVSTFPADPVQSGGQRRLRGMASGLVEHGWLPTVLSLTNRLGPESIRRRRTSDGVRHVMVGRSADHLRADFAMASLLGSPIDDVAAAELWPSTPAFGAELRSLIDSSDAIVLSHPFLVSAVEAATPQSGLPPVVYDAYNVETELKQRLFAGRAGADWVAQRAATAEAAALGLASLVSATSADDLRTFRAMARSTAPAVIALNPLDPSLFEPRSEAERVDARARFLLDQGLIDDARPLAVFLGSDHPPNRSAAERCVELASLRPDLHVVIAGTVAVERLHHGDRPTIVGSFDTGDLRRLQVMADVVLNPVDAGSGTSLKLIDPLALGVPVVSTAVGARGIQQAADVVWLTEADPNSVAAAIDRVLAEPAERERRTALGIQIATRARPEEAMRELAEQLDAMVASAPNS